ncbi:MAG: TVP38/TMEM64 family protein [bacterium]|nr:TVP38/TMEM64 family protein [bacterium]
MYNANTTKIIEGVRLFMTRAYTRATLPYFALGLLLIIAIVVGGRELEHHINAIELWLTKLGPWSVIAFIGLFVLATSFLLPDTVLCIIAGALFGVYWGIAAVLAGSLLAGAVQFAISQKFLRARIQQTIAAKPSLNAIQRSVRHDQFRLQLLLRLTPLNPATINYLLGATGVRFSGFLIACLALTPNLAVEVYIGYAGMHAARMAGKGAQTAHLQDLMVIGGILLCAVGMILMSRMAHKAVMKAVAETKKAEDTGPDEMLST